MRYTLLGLVIALSTVLSAAEDSKRQVVLIAGRPSHGPGEHEHNAGVQLLAKCLRDSASKLVDVEVSLNGQWPSDAVIEKADTIVIYSDGGDGHPALGHLDQLTKKMAAGCGLVCLHYAVEPAYVKAGWLAADGSPSKTPTAGRSSVGKGAKEFKEWLGGYFEQHWSVNPTWEASFTQLPHHPISRGVKPFMSKDEWYFYMRFRDGMEGVSPILSAIAPASTMVRRDGPHQGNKEVRASVAKGEPQVVAWAVERTDKGRGFGFTGAHYHNNWANDAQRKVVLNAILWTAKAEVPADGVESKLSADDLAANLDKKR